MDDPQESKSTLRANDACHGVYGCMIQATSENRISRSERLFRRIRVGISNMFFRFKRDGIVCTLKYVMRNKLDLKSKQQEVTMDKIQDLLNLQPGEWVEVRSEQEILRTLDADHKYKGLRFMAGMEKCCGRRYKVYKRLQRMLMESTGECRKIKNSVLLEGAMCDGEPYNGCDRSCFFYWREVWLKRVEGENIA